jgi:Uma2 family endonuclease
MGMPLTQHRFTVDEYHRMGQAGVFREDDRVELIRGHIVEMTPIGPEHAGCVDYLAHALDRGLASRAIVRVQNPVVLDRHVELQPDLALLRPRPGFYRNAHPGPADTLLIVEVADTSLQYDREEKLALYAEAGIPEVWLVDLPGKVIETYREPRGGGYRVARTARRGESVAPRAFPDLSLTVEDVLG